MTRFAVAAPPRPAIPISGSDAVFPVRRIYAIGRNFGDHAAETGLGPAGMPGISLKPADSIVVETAVVPYPKATSELDPEVEMVIAISVGGEEIPQSKALNHVFGYAVGFDLIRRDIMRECIVNQHSWDLCKSFDGASPVGPIRRVSDGGHPNSGRIASTVNGRPCQAGDLSQMIWKTAEIISRLSTYSRLQPGDIVFSGTPKGPRAVERGDRVEGVIEGLGSLGFNLV